MAKDRRVKVELQCEVCKEKNYSTTVIRQSEEKLELMKFCHRRCKEHTLHRQKKISSNRK